MVYVITGFRITSLATTHAVAILAVVVVRFSLVAPFATLATLANLAIVATLGDSITATFGTLGAFLTALGILIC